MSARKVLVVDDDHDIREITAMALELVGGCRVIDTDRGSTALQIAVDEQPDLVLLDVMMPELDGPATFRRLQSDPRTRHIPVIMVTAKATAENEALWCSLGVLGVIAKPFDPVSLVERIDVLVATRLHTVHPPLSA